MDFFSRFQHHLPRHTAIVISLAHPDKRILAGDVDVCTGRDYGQGSLAVACYIRGDSGRSLEQPSTGHPGTSPVGNFRPACCGGPDSASPRMRLSFMLRLVPAAWAWVSCRVRATLQESRKHPALPRWQVRLAILASSGIDGSFWSAPVLGCCGLILCAQYLREYLGHSPSIVLVQPASVNRTGEGHRQTDKADRRGGRQHPPAHGTGPTSGTA